MRQAQILLPNGWRAVALSRRAEIRGWRRAGRRGSGGRPPDQQSGCRPVAPSRRAACPGRIRCACAVAVAAVAAAALTGCAWTRDTVPRCADFQRLAVIAQSVPTASYVPCVLQLPQGWRTSAFDPHRGGTRFLLESDRAPGRPVRVELKARCAVAGQSPEPPRADGVLTYMGLRSTTPDYAGTLYDVFPGGCVTYRFDFIRGPLSITLMPQWEGAVGLYPRQQLRLDLRKKLGVELDP
jgi:hypothetical protein